jgi:hypothetical protein
MVSWTWYESCQRSIMAWMGMRLIGIVRQCHPTCRYMRIMSDHMALLNNILWLWLSLNFKKVSSLHPANVTSMCWKLIQNTFRCSNFRLWWGFPGRHFAAHSFHLDYIISKEGTRDNFSSFIFEKNSETPLHATQHVLHNTFCAS